MPDKLQQELAAIREHHNARRVKSLKDFRAALVESAQMVAGMRVAQRRQSERMAWLADRNRVWLRRLELVERLKMPELEAEACRQLQAVIDEVERLAESLPEDAKELGEYEVDVRVAIAEFELTRKGLASEGMEVEDLAMPAIESFEDEQAYDLRIAERELEADINGTSKEDLEAHTERVFAELERHHPPEPQ